MTWTPQGPSALSWLRRYLDDGGLLANYVIAMLTESVSVSAIVPDGFEGRLDADFSVGGRHLDRQAVLATVRGVMENHLRLSSNSCVLVEDLWAKKEYPCGQRSLPWITVASNRHEELYWIWDRRSLSRGANAALGAATGRRYFAVLSRWQEKEPEQCSTQSDEYLLAISSLARALLVEIFDGESYMLVEL